MKLIIQSIFGAILAFFMIRYTKVSFKKGANMKCANYRTILFGLLFFCMLEISRLVVGTNPLLEGMTAAGMDKIKTDLASVCNSQEKNEFTFNDDTQLSTCKFGEINEDDYMFQMMADIGTYDKPSNTVSVSLYNAATYYCKRLADGNPGIVDGKFTCSVKEPPDDYEIQRIDLMKKMAEDYGGTYDEKNKRSTFPQIIVPTVKSTAKPTARPTVRPTVKPTVKPTIKPTVTTAKPTARPTVTTFPAAPVATVANATNLEKDCDKSRGNWIFDSEKRQGICIYGNI